MRTRIIQSFNRYGRRSYDATWHVRMRDNPPALMHSRLTASCSCTSFSRHSGAGGASRNGGSGGTRICNTNPKRSCHTASVATSSTSRLAVSHIHMCPENTTYGSLHDLQLASRPLWSCTRACALASVVLAQMQQLHAHGNTIAAGSTIGGGTGSCTGCKVTWKRRRYIGLCRSPSEAFSYYDSMVWILLIQWNGVAPALGPWRVRAGTL